MNRIRKLRLERGISQSRLAQQAATHQATVSHLERGRMDVRRVTSYKLLERVAEALGVEVEELLEDEPAVA